jgi:putative restriction endonuclease
MKARKSNTDPTTRELIVQDAKGAFSDDVKKALRSDPILLTDIATRLLEEHFPESIHSDILSAVGLMLGVMRVEKKRDPKFRQRVLVAYEYRCAVCGFDVRLGSVSIALDAAHIRWHQANGPDREGNGLALCALHHKIFDLGAFTVNDEGVLLVSDQANGSTGFQEMLLGYHGKAIRPPQRQEWKPEVDFLDWHKNEVFKGEARQ